MDIQLEGTAPPTSGSRVLKERINEYWSDGAEGYQKSIRNSLQPGMLKKARENAERLGLPVDFKQGDAESIPFEDESFDVVVNRDVLWTLPNPDTALREWKRVLRPGGRLAVIDGNWYININRSLKNRIWRGFALLLATIRERSFALRRHAEPDWRKKLPMTFRKRPEYDIELLKGLGFTDINVCIIDRRRFGLAEFLRYGYFGDSFMISARKK